MESKFHLTYIIILVILVCLILMVILLNRNKCQKVNKNICKPIHDQRELPKIIVIPKPESPPVTPPVLTEDAQDIINSIEVRMRSLSTLAGADEVYIGPLAGSGGFPNRIQEDFVWTQNGLNPFTISYTPSTDEMIFTCQGITAVYQPVNPNVSVVNSDWDIMQIYIANRDAGTTVNIIGLEVTDNDNGITQTIGDLIGPNGVWKTWYVNFDWSGNWTLSGSVELAGSFGGSQELSKVGVVLGQIVTI